VPWTVDQGRRAEIGNWLTIIVQPLGDLEKRPAVRSGHAAITPDRVWIKLDVEVAFLRIFMTPASAQNPRPATRPALIAGSKDGIEA
jgi:hypothetical protein